MAVTPTGDPPWVRTVDFSQYGGHLQKRDFMGQGAINPYTDASAAQCSRLYSDLAAVVRTAAFGDGVLLCNDTVPDAPTIECVHMQTGVRTTSYEGDAAPSGFPSGARNGNGSVTLTFSGSYDDEYGVTGALTLRGAHATGYAASGVHRNVTWEISGSTVTFRVTNDAGAAVSDARISWEVW